MAKLLKLRRGTTSQHGSFTGAEGEVTVDTDKDTLVVHDGSTAGGHELLREDMSNLPAGTIDNADVNASAAIAGTKISPNFGTQNIISGAITTAGALNINSSDPSIYFNDSDANPDFRLRANGGELKFIDTTNNNADRLVINSDGHVDVIGNLDVGAGIDVTGASTFEAITATGNITISSTGPQILFTDTNNDPDYGIWNNDGTLRFVDTGANATRFEIQAGGLAKANNNLQVVGNITVSGTVDGRDVASDGSKLDGIESGATADQTAEEIQDIVGAMLSGNTESGITVTYQDGDGTIDFAVASQTDQNFTTTLKNKLDGIAASATNVTNNNQLTNGAGYITSFDITTQTDSKYLRSNAADTATGDITFQGGAGAVSVSSGSDIRIDGGSWTGEYTTGIKLQGNGADSYIQYEGSLYLRNTSGSNKVQVDSSGNFTADGNVTAYSDARLKTDIHTINDALSICGKLRGVSYKWIKDGKPSIGVIAQEVEEVLPELVLNNLDADPATGETTEVKSVDYGKIVGVLINAINELKAELDEHKKGGK